MGERGSRGVLVRFEGSKGPVVRVRVRAGRPP